MRKSIAIDVDGTLIIAAQVNTALVEWCRRRKADGFAMMLWSARGREHALAAAKLADAMDVFDPIISKPSYIVDDKGWSWIKHTKVMAPNEFESPDQTQGT